MLTSIYSKTAKTDGLLAVSTLNKKTLNFIPSSLIVNTLNQKIIANSQYSQSENPKLVFHLHYQEVRKGFVLVGLTSPPVGQYVVSCR